MNTRGTKNQSVLWQGWHGSVRKAWYGAVTQGKASPTSVAWTPGIGRSRGSPPFHPCVRLLPSDVPFAVASVQLPPPRILAWLSPPQHAALSSKARMRQQRHGACRSAVTLLLSCSTQLFVDGVVCCFVTRNARCPAFVSSLSLFLSSVCFFGVDRAHGDSSVQ